MFKVKFLNLFAIVLFVGFFLFGFSSVSFANEPTCVGYSGPGGGWYCYGSTTCTLPDGNSSGNVSCSTAICGTNSANFQCDTGSINGFGPPYYSSCHVNCGGGGPSSPSVSIGGRVVNSVTGAPVSNAKIILQIYSGNDTSVIAETKDVVTNGSGDYLFENAIYPNGSGGNFRYRLTAPGNVSGYQDNGYLVDWRYGKDSTWGEVIPKAVQDVPWIGVPTRVGQNIYNYQTAGRGCASSGSGDGATDAPANRCWFALTPAPFASISGSIKDSDTGALITSPVTLTVVNITNNTSKLVTTVGGSYDLSDFIHIGEKYSIEVTTAPIGYDSDALAVSYDYNFAGNLLPSPTYSIPFTWDVDNARDTSSQYNIYDNQVAGTNDCATAVPAASLPAGRCIFVLNKFSTVGGMLVDSKTRGGVSNVSVKITNLTKSTSVTVVSNSAGVYSTSAYSNFIAAGNRYSVSVVPTGFNASTYLSATTYDWRTDTGNINVGSIINYTMNRSVTPNTDTRVGLSEYTGQTLNNFDDCSASVNGVSGRCWFAMNRIASARVSAEVMMDYPVNGNFSPYIVSRLQNSQPIEIKSSDGVSSVFNPMTLNGTQSYSAVGGNCLTAFPDNKNAPNCDNYFNSVNISTGRASLRVISPSGLYTCQWENPDSPFGNRRMESIPLVRDQNEGDYYCQTPTFAVIEDTTGTLNANSYWSTLVRIKLTPTKSHILSNVFTRVPTQANDVAGTGRFVPTSNIGYRPSFAGGGNSSVFAQTTGVLPTTFSWFGRAPWTYSGYNNNAFIYPSYTKDGFSDGSTFVAQITPPVANQVCYYKVSNLANMNGFSLSQNFLDLATANNLNEVDPSVSPGNYLSLLNSMTYSPNCTNIRGNASLNGYGPGYNNTLNVLVAPKISLEPYQITIVDGPDQCGSAGTNITSSANPYFSLFRGGNRVLTNVTSSVLSAQGLIFPSTYQVNLEQVTINGETYAASDISKIGFCSDDGTSGINRDDIDLGTLIPTYPDIPNADGSIPGSFQIYIKDSNNWWQVYNGGVHSNFSSISVDSFARPSDSVLVGDPSAAAIVLPNEYNLTDFNTGGLVSFSLINPSNYSNFGMSNRDWSVKQDENSDGLKALDINTVIKKITSPGSNWQNIGNVSNALSNRYSFMRVNSTSINNEFTNYNFPSNKVVLFMDAGNGSNVTLTIKSNITRTDGSGLLFLIVNGDVVIDPAVTQVDAVIYTTKTATIKSTGNDLDVSNLIQGALYTQDGYVFNRDLPNDLASLDKPGQQILFKPEIFTKKGGTGAEFPPELLESNIYFSIE